MSARIALLRAVNLGPASRVSSQDLKAVFQAAGLDEVRTLLASGNVVFRGGDADGAKVEALLEQRLKAEIGLLTDVFIRTAEEWEEAVEANPFPTEAREHPGHLVLMALKAAPVKAEAAALEAATSGLPETVKVIGRHAYIVYPEGIGRSKLKLKVLGTARNWNTVVKLQAMVRD